MPPGFVWVRHFARLTLRVRDHVARRGADEQASAAAAAVLRYFDVAAPLHHQDEEQDLFAALRALGDEPLNGRLDALQAEHAVLDGLWSAIRPWLQAVSDGRLAPAPDEVESFSVSEILHADREEAQVYPAARRLDAGQVRELGRRMAARRTTR